MEKLLNCSGNYVEDKPVGKWIRTLTDKNGEGETDTMLASRYKNRCHNNFINDCNDILNHYNLYWSHDYLISSIACKSEITNAPILLDLLVHQN